MRLFAGMSVGHFPKPLRAAAVTLGLLLAAASRAAVPVPVELAQRAAAGEVLDVIVEYEAVAIDRDLSARRARLPRGMSDDALLAEQSRRYRQLKDDADRAGRHPQIETLRDYSHLPMRQERVRSAAALAALAAQPRVRAIFPERVYQRVLSQSLPLIGQPEVAAAGYGGAGQTVAVIDDGVDIGNPAFGGCAAPGLPATCRIKAVENFVAIPSISNAHGTNSSAIVTAVASQASVVMLDVFSETGALVSDIIAAINWAIANAGTYGIVAINMSLGDASSNTSACSSRATNPFVKAVEDARSTGISVVVSAGNSAYKNGVFTAGIANPACTAGVISVGAVYDDNVGVRPWGGSFPCTDASTQANQVACFSQSASILTMLAPGALITAGGFTFGGTSEAAPHVAGAVAVLRAAYPADTLSATQNRLTSSSVQITDTRNGVTKPRLALDQVVPKPANDAFASRIALAVASGSTTGTTRLATRETGEPQHAAAGSRSVWWRWTATASGQVSLDTTGSSFDTLLGVYTGSSVGSLARIVSRDNTAASPQAQLFFQAQSGTTYQWAVDGANSESGSVALQWALNSAAAANLSVSVSGPSTATPGSTLAYVLTVSNAAGSQTATGVRASLVLPAGLNFSSGPGSCTLEGTSVVCTADDLAGGSSVSWTLQLMVGSLGSGFNLNSTVTSELPDPVASNNSNSFSVTPQAGAGTTTASVPALPLWAAVLMALGLGWQLRRAVLRRAAL